MRQILILLSITLSCCIATPAIALDKIKREKVIDFDDEVVEGMNRRPLDSLATISDGGKKRKKVHLYRKRVSFRGETTESLKALRYAP